MINKNECIKRGCRFLHKCRPDYVKAEMYHKPEYAMTRYECMKVMRNLNDMQTCPLECSLDRH